jgi:hypothetical protein
VYNNAAVRIGPAAMALNANPAATTALGPVGLLSLRQWNVTGGMTPTPAQEDIRENFPPIFHTYAARFETWVYRP